MPPTQKTDAPTDGTDVRLRVAVFDALMSARGHDTVVAQAEALNVHRSTIFRMRDGENAPNLKLAMRMAAFCNTTVEVLFERTAA